MVTTGFSKQLSAFDPDEWIFHGMWKQELFAAYFWTACFDGMAMKKAGIPIAEIGYIVFNGGYYLNSKKLAAQIRGLAADSLKSGDLAVWRNLKREAEAAYRSMLELSAQAPAALNADNWREAVRLGKLCTLYWAIAAGYLCPAADELAQEAVAQEVLGISALATLVREPETPLAVHRRELMALKGEFMENRLPFTAQSVEQNADLERKLETHLKNYFWIETSSWIGRPLTMRGLLGMIEATELHEEARSRDGYSQNLKDSLELFDIAGYLRQAGAEYFMLLSASYMKALEDYAAKLGVEYKELLRLTPDELLDELEGRETKEELIEHIRQRANGNWVSLHVDGRDAVIENERDVELLIELTVPKFDPSSLEVVGQTGNPGLARGTARIIMNTEDFGKMRPGDVLVSTMTTPDFVVLMGLASAIVTDNGGLLCHAAIVAREIGKPCVIGTGHATELLHDGDEVEVDATNGKVRILGGASS